MNLNPAEFQDQQRMVTTNQARLEAAQLEAEARVYRAAPELLAALRELVQQVTGFQDCNGDKGFILSDAIAAITEATGRPA